MDDVKRIASFLLSSSSFLFCFFVVFSFLFEGVGGINRGGGGRSFVHMSVDMHATSKIYRA